MAGSLRELADLLVDQAASSGIINARRCRLDVISDDMYREMIRINWYMYAMSLDNSVSDETFCILSDPSWDDFRSPRLDYTMNNYRIDFITDLENSILECITVVNTHAIKETEWYYLIDGADLINTTREFARTNTSIRKI